MCNGPAVLPGYHWVSAGRSTVTGGRSYTGHGTSGTSGTSGGVSRGGFGAHGSSSVGA